MFSSFPRLQKMHLMLPSNRRWKRASRKIKAERHKGRKDSGRTTRRAQKCSSDDAEKSRESHTHKKSILRKDTEKKNRFIILWLNNVPCSDFPKVENEGEILGLATCGELDKTFQIFFFLFKAVAYYLPSTYQCTTFFLTCHKNLKRHKISRSQRERPWPKVQQVEDRSRTPAPPLHFARNRFSLDGKLLPCDWRCARGCNLFFSTCVYVLSYCCASCHRGALWVFSSANLILSLPLSLRAPAAVCPVAPASPGLSMLQTLFWHASF